MPCTYLGMKIWMSKSYNYSHAYTIGCDRCFSMDGNWKLCFPHCMFPVSAGVPGLPTLNVPNICPNQLKKGSAFCEHHFEVALNLNYPTDIKGFLKFCGVVKTPGTQN